MKWVLNTYQTAQNWPVERMIELCQATGYEGIELLQDFKQEHGVEASAPDSHVTAVADKVRSSGLFISSLTSCCNFHSLEEPERRRNLDQVKRVIDQAALIGCDHVRVLGDRLPPDETAKQQVLANVGSALRELGTYAAPQAIRVSIEAHGSFTDPVYAVRVVREASLPNVGIVFNSQWRVGAEEGWALPPGAASIAPLYDMLAPYLTAVHTHQMEQPEVLGYYREFFHYLVRDGFQGAVSNECAYTGPDPEKVLRLYTALFRSFTS